MTNKIISTVFELKWESLAKSTIERTKIAKNPTTFTANKV